MENFYTLNPQEYIKATFQADMSNEYRFYLHHLKPQGRILEIGFGSARDLLYFKNRIGEFILLSDPSERAGIRTPDNLIKSQVLYHLSYTPLFSFPAYP